MITNFHEALAPLVERAAVRTSNNWPSYVSIEDVQQELWAWCYEKRSSVETAMRLDGWEAKIYSTMLRVASGAASKEDQAANGYTKDDTYAYSTEVIEVILESVFQYEDWQSFGAKGDGQPRAKGQVNETGDMIAMLVDVKTAIASIDKRYREVLLYKHGMRLTHDQVGEALGISKDAAHKRQKRAVQALREQLGRVNPADLRQGWDGRRAALGNERSNIITDRQYEG